MKTRIIRQLATITRYANLLANASDLQAQRYDLYVLAVDTVTTFPGVRRCLVW